MTGAIVLKETKTSCQKWNILIVPILFFSGRISSKCPKCFRNVCHIQRHIPETAASVEWQPCFCGLYTSVYFGSKRRIRNHSQVIYCKLLLKVLSDWKSLRGQISHSKICSCDASQKKNHSVNKSLLFLLGKSACNHCYHRPTKLREGNVFIRVCLSVSQVATRGVFP